MVMWSVLSITNIVAAFLGKRVNHNVFYRVNAHDRETDHPQVVFIDPNDLS